MSKQRLTVVGGGQMGRALVGGMLSRGVVSQADVRLVEPSEPSRVWWSEKYPGVTVGDNLASAVDGADIVLLAVKPDVVAQVVKQPTNFWAKSLVISIAAGVGLEKLCRWIQHERVVRVMPNTPCLIGQGACAYCTAAAVTADDAKRVESMLASVGLVVRVDDSQMDAVTGLSGSGPAYVCLMVEALADGGVAAGLARPLAMQLATQTVLGAAQMIAQTGQHPGQLKDAVASPGGTTIAALATLEQNGVRGALIEAVVASARRSRELDSNN